MPSTTVIDGNDPLTLSTPSLLVEAGACSINSALNPSHQTPFGKELRPYNIVVRTKLIHGRVGGWKESGIGRESGYEGIKAYLQPKTLVVSLHSRGHWSACADVDIYRMHINMNVKSK